jgi:hypothetical protein
LLTARLGKAPRNVKKTPKKAHIESKRINMADSLDNKANNKNITVDAESLDEMDLLKNHLKVALEIMPELGSDIKKSTSTITHKP